MCRLNLNRRSATFLTISRRKIDDYEELLTENPLWMDRTQGIGFISAEDAIALGCTGPVLRGSGVNWDIRKAMPYSGYEHFEFDVPLGQHGDVYDRYLVPDRGDAPELADHPAGTGQAARRPVPIK